MRPSLVPLLVCVLVTASHAGETRTALSDDGLFTVTETRLYDKDLAGGLIGQVISPDRAHIGVVTEKRGRQRVWSDLFGLGPECRQVVGVFFSPDGRRMATAGIRKDGRTEVVVDGRSVGDYRQIVNNEILFTDDGAHYVFIADTGGDEQDGRFFVVMDGQAQPRYTRLQSLDPDNPTQMVATDGGRVIYFARDGNRHFIVVDGQEGPAFDRTGFGPAVSEDGRHVAYVGFRGDQAYVVADTTVHGPYPQIDLLLFPPGSADPAYVATWPDSTRIFIGYRPVPVPYPLVKAPLIDAEGHLRCYWTSDGTRSLIAGDYPSDAPGMPDYHSVSTPWLTEDGHHYVYEMVFDPDFRSKAFVVDGKLLDTVECPGNYKIQFSPDGRQMATYCYSRDPVHCAMRLGAEQTLYDAYWVDLIQYSDDGAHWVTRVIPEHGKPFLLRDGVEIPVESIYGAPVISPDGRHVAYTVRNNKGNKEYLVVDDTSFKTYTSVSDRELAFNPDGSLTGYPRHEFSRLYRVTITPNEP